jgi:hypothetical protein
MLSAAPGDFLAICALAAIASGLTLSIIRLRENIAIFPRSGGSSELVNLFRSNVGVAARPPRRRPSGYWRRASVSLRAFTAQTAGTRRSCPHQYGRPPRQSVGGPN